MRRRGRVTKSNSQVWNWSRYYLEEFIQLLASKNWRRRRKCYRTWCTWGWVNVVMVNKKLCVNMERTEFSLHDTFRQNWDFFSFFFFSSLCCCRCWIFACSVSLGCYLLNFKIFLFFPSLSSWEVYQAGWLADYCKPRIFFTTIYCIFLQHS